MLTLRLIQKPQYPNLDKFNQFWTSVKLAPIFQVQKYRSSLNRSFNSPLKY